MDKPLAVVAELSEGVGRVHQRDLDVSEEIHFWRLDESVPFGGHYLLICNCGCPGPFVLNVAEARTAVCGIEMAWREGAARLSMCLPDPGLEGQGRSALRHE